MSLTWWSYKTPSICELDGCQKNIAKLGPNITIVQLYYWIMVESRFLYLILGLLYTILVFKVKKRDQLLRFCHYLPGKHWVWGFLHILQLFCNSRSRYLGLEALFLHVWLMKYHYTPRGPEDSHNLCNIRPCCIILKYCAKVFNNQYYNPKFWFPIWNTEISPVCYRGPLVRCYSRPCKTLTINKRFEKEPTWTNFFLKITIRSIWPDRTATLFITSVVIG